MKASAIIAAIEIAQKAWTAFAGLRERWRRKKLEKQVSDLNDRLRQLAEG